MPVPRLPISRAVLRSVAQVFDLTGTLASSRLREIREQAQAGGTTRDWERVTGDLHRAVQRHAAGHAE
jgi:hypothetical protein